ncbi:MAG: 50S ribosomal protein L29 [SAR202 cluster bacterium]|nr:50S ribosomal protein L29 [SAR202 cluster bacterium]
MEIDDIRALGDADLATELVESRKDQMNLRFRAATMQLANVHEISKIRKRIARINTVIRERELARTAR